jgi:hypothetical protein
MSVFKRILVRDLYPEIRTFERWLRGHVPAFERALAS